VSALALIGVVTSLANWPHGARSDSHQVSRPNAISSQTCRSINSLPDSKIYECLNQQVHALETKMTSALRKESQFLSFTSTNEGWRVAMKAQSALLAYMHQECLAQATPYQPGTIVPIIYGECALSLERQRLALIQQQTKYFRSGGLAGPAT
jgi:uncharacterized protein YecT (DUF1311 family)